MMAKFSSTIANILKAHYHDFETSKRMYENSIRCHDNLYARVNLALLLEDQFKDYKAALDNYKRALELQPNDIRIILKIATMYEESFANKKKALEYFEMAGKINKEEPTIQENIKRLKK